MVSRSRAAYDWHRCARGNMGKWTDATDDHDESHRPATDLGYLLHKHPARCQSYDLSFGSVHVFYPEATDDRCSACLLLDVDPVGIVRGKGSAEGLAVAVRERSTLRGLVVPERGDRTGLRLGAPGPVQGSP